MNFERTKRAVIALALAVCCAEAASASENGGSHAGLGYSDTLTGIAPDPGFYVRNDVNYYTADRDNDRNGNAVQFNAGPFGKQSVVFRESVWSDAVQLFYETPWTVPVLDASYGFGIIGFFADSHVKFQTAGGPGPETRRGFGDTTITPAYLGWHFPQWNLHVTANPLQFDVPTGEYNQNDALGNNIGRNYWSLTPSLGITYVNETGQEVSTGLNYLYNFTNPATNYKTGQEFYLSYAVQQYLSRWFSLGVSGYYYRQLTNDIQNGVVVNTTPTAPFGVVDPFNQGPGNIGSVFAFGPTVSYNLNNQAYFNLHWDHEMFAVDHVAGDSFWFRAAVPF